MLILFIGFFVFSLILISFMLTNPESATIFGWILAALFGGLAIPGIFTAIKRMNIKYPALAISDEGVRLHIYNPEGILIPWDEIVLIKEEGMMTNTVMYIHVRDAEKYMALPIKGMAKRNMNMIMKSKRTPFAIQGMILDAEIDTVRTILNMNMIERRKEG